jgi:hypothetical protein
VLPSPANRHLAMRLHLGIRRSNREVRGLGELVNCERRDHSLDGFVPVEVWMASYRSSLAGIYGMSQRSGAGPVDR